uniref:Uncharacterized protein n=1 Tax=Cannabis sativa TaxID=3483 RepID=A0A803NFA0_CANSA
MLGVIDLKVVELMDEPVKNVEDEMVFRRGATQQGGRGGNIQLFPVGDEGFATSPISLRIGSPSTGSHLSNARMGLELGAVGAHCMRSTLSTVMLFSKLQELAKLTFEISQQLTRC